MNAFQFVKTLVHSQFFVTPPLPTASFANQTIIVTGSNTGVGYETVKHLVRLDAKRIILAVRDTTRGENAVQKILKETGCDPTRLEVWAFDLSSYDSIRAFVQRADKLERLDVVVQNAGIIPPATWTADADGAEITLKVDTFGPLYFAYAILPKLRASAEKTGSMGRLSLNGSDVMFISNLMKQKRLQDPLLDALNDPKQEKVFGDR
jgi:NAD(P)-dependent dehydrogenase (short-subunit alcohol dehydrogenase family)